MSRSTSTPFAREGRSGSPGTLLPLLTTLILTLGLTVLPACPGPDQGGGVALDDRDLLEVLPGDVALLAWIDVAGFRSVTPEEGLPFAGFHGPAGARFQGALDRDAIAELQRKTGIDLHRDVHQAALGVIADDSDTEAARRDLIAVLRLDYDVDRLAAYLEGRPTREYRSHTLHRLPSEDFHGLVDEEDDRDDDSGTSGADEDSMDEVSADEESMDEESSDEGSMDEESSDEGSMDGDSADDEPHPKVPVFVVMLDDEVLLVGTEGALRSSLDLLAGEGAPVTANAELGDLLSRLPAERHFLVVVGGDAFSQGLRRGVPERSPVPRKALANLQGAALSGHVDADLVSTLNVVGVSDSADNAKLLRESVQGMLALGKMMLQQRQPEVFEIVDRAVTVEQDDAEVRIRVRMTREDGETLRRFAVERFDEQLPEGEGVEESETETG